MILNLPRDLGFEGRLGEALLTARISVSLYCDAEVDTKDALPPRDQLSANHPVDFLFLVKSKRP